MADPQTFGRYLLRRRIAAGGMGEVFVAEQTGVGDFRKPLALKLMLPGLDDEPRNVRLFLAEARLAARLQHPNIVEVYDAGVIDGRYFLTMELIDGVTVNALVRALRASQRLISAQALSHLARQTLEALRHAHDFKDEAGQRLDVVHRDISPSNILVSRRGEVKLTDFGIAKVRDGEGNSAPGELRGKLAYIAPELFQGASASVRSDLYALGVTLYRLAALVSPFGSADDSDPSAALLHRKARPLAQLRPDLDSEVVAVIERAISAAPADRHPSAAAMLESLPRGDFEARQAELVGLVELALGAAPAPAPAATAPMELSSAAPTLVAVAGQPGPRQRGWAVLAGLAVGLAAVAGFWRLQPGGPGVEPTAVNRPGPEEANAGALSPPAADPGPAGVGAASAAGASSVGAKGAAEVNPSAARGAGEVTSSGATPSAPGGSPASAPARSTGTVSPQAAASKRPPPARSARLATPALVSIQAQPWANVELNGRPIGQTPLARVPVTVSSVVLRFSTPGYRSSERRFKVTDGEELKVNEAMER